MTVPLTRRQVDRELAAGSRGLGEAIAAALETAIDEGALAIGGRLPTVRGLAAQLRVSPATVAGAYEELGRRGRTRGEAGRGTFVVDRSRAAGPVGTVAAPASTSVVGSVINAPGTPWRRRLQAQTTARLLAAHPRAIDCASGAPDPALLPMASLRRGFGSALAATAASDLQYGVAEPLGELVEAITERLGGAGIDVGPRQVTVASSALQLIELGLRAAARRAAWERPIVAVEQPGYATVLDAVDRLGWSTTGIPVDAEGATPDGLAAALTAGARLIILTPRAHNPTGASWTAQRRDRLAEVLAGWPDAVVIEDDHCADIAVAPPASLIVDPRLRSRVIHVRSFSKALAPDLRVAAAVAAPSLRGLMVEEKSYVDGWTSRLSQRALARILRDADLPRLLAAATAAYAERRDAAVDALFASPLGDAGGSVARAADGTNVWVRLPAGVDESAVLERTAAAGFVAGPGEIFHLRPGSAGAVRLTVSVLPAEEAAAAATALAEAAVQLADASPAACAAVT